MSESNILIVEMMPLFISSYFGFLSPDDPEDSGRVMKNMGMPGRMGHDQVLMRHLTVVGIKPEENLLLLRGAVPGTRNGLVVVFNRAKDFETRYKKPE